MKEFEHLGSLGPGKIAENRRGLLIDFTFPKMICLCGSTKFVNTFNEVNRELTLLGYIVLSVGCHVHSDNELKVTEEEKIQLDELHKRKIDLSDAVLVLNVDNYIGDSTRSEITYATQAKKPVGYLWADSNRPQKSLKETVVELLNKKEEVR